VVFFYLENGQVLSQETWFAFSAILFFEFSKKH
jgi:hypothetical protein